MQRKMTRAFRSGSYTTHMRTKKRMELVRRRPAWVHRLPKRSLRKTDMAHPGPSTRASKNMLRKMLPAMLPILMKSW